MGFEFEPPLSSELFPKLNKSKSDKHYSSSANDLRGKSRQLLGKTAVWSTGVRKTRTGRRDMTEILLKTTLNPNSSIARQVFAKIETKINSEHGYKKCRHVHTYSLDNKKQTYKIVRMNQNI